MLKAKVGIWGNIKLATAPIPCMSAPIFSVIAGKLTTAIKYKILFGYFFLSVPVNPSFVTIPILAHISCTAAIKGKVIIAVHRVAKPKPAPAYE